MDNLVLSKQELVSKLDMLESPRDKALLSFLYISGCRIQEVLKHKARVCQKCNTKVKAIKRENIWHKDYCKKCKLENVAISYKYIQPAITNQQIVYENGMLLIKDVRTLKRTTEVKRCIPSSIDDDRFFIKIIDDYIANLTMQEPLFTISRQTANKILKKVGLHPHMLRQARLTHLVADYGFTEQELKEFVGWKDIRQASKYVPYCWQNLADKMINSKQCNKPSPAEITK